MTDVLMIGLSAVVQIAVTWGVVKTQLDWLRRDVDMLMERQERMNHRLRLMGTGNA